MFACLYGLLQHHSRLFIYTTQTKIEWIYIAARFRFASFSLTIFVYPCEPRVCICFTSLHFIFLSFRLFFCCCCFCTQTFDYTVLYAFICTAHSFRLRSLEFFSLFFFSSACNYKNLFRFFIWNTDDSPNTQSLFLRWDEAWFPLWNTKTKITSISSPLNSN